MNVRKMCSATGCLDKMAVLVLKENVSARKTIISEATSAGRREVNIFKENC
jgi:hypothetical protein